MVRNSILQDLNPEQRRAVRHGLGDTNAAPLRIIAGAGSGKTKCLAHRVAYLVHKGADPQRILLITFTNKAARELTSRAQSLLGNQARSLRWAGTFHGVAARLLRFFGEHVGLSSNFTILDSDDAIALMTWARRQVTHSKDEDIPKPAMLLRLFSLAVNLRKPVRKVLVDDGLKLVDAEKVRKVFKAYRHAKRTQSVVDFDDLLLLWLKLMKGPAREVIRRQFDFVLIDEYQDTNLLQARILKRLRPNGCGVTVVGDDAQSIYSFRAAEVDNILRFDEQFATPTTSITLDRNYRSTPEILACANAAMAGAANRIEKNLRATRPPGRLPKILFVDDAFVEAEIVAHRIEVGLDKGVPLREQAVLFRSSLHSSLLEIELGRRSIPFRKLGGMRLAEAAHVKDLVAFVRWVENPADRAAGFRVLRLVHGIGVKSADNILDAVTRIGLERALLARRPPAALRAAWQTFKTLMASVSAPHTELAFAIESIATWLAPSLKARFDNPEERQQELQQLVVLAERAKSRAQFIEDLTLEGSGGKNNDSEEVLTLATIHSAKGLEFEHVQILRLIEGGMPSSYATIDEQFAEEQRLLYVAMTRAKSRLAMIVPREIQFPKGGRKLVTPSRFLTKAVRKRCMVKTV